MRTRLASSRWPALLVACGVLALLPARPVHGQAATSGKDAGPRRLSLDYTMFTLPNGLRVVLHEDHSVPIVAVDVWYHVGSAREKPGRTGFAHLFEHLMFEGSKHVKEGQFDQLLEGVGGDNNGSTTSDRTNYVITVPSNALELALFLESDRMGYLLDTMTPATVDGQRDVVKNERRQSYENRPYGMASIVLGEMLYPPEHPYHWPTIGYMDDLSAASYEDVVEFFKKYYRPNNASLVLAGDFDTARARQLVEKWFSDVPRGPFVEPMAVPPAYLTGIKQRTLTDRVQLPRLYLAWLTPAAFEPGDAELDIAASVLAGGKNSRLYRRLVYELQVAQDVSAFQQSADLSSSFLVVVTPQPGHSLQELKTLVDEELQKLRDEPPQPREVQRAINEYEASFYSRMERVEGFGGTADQMNSYLVLAGNPDYFEEDLSRYRAVAPDDVQAVIRSYLPADRRVELSIVPETNGGEP